MNANINDVLVSVIMPAHNVEHYISEAIDSVFNQTLQNWELIVIDDGSSDATGKILESYMQDEQNKALKFKPYYQNNAGAGAARNTGIAKAKGSVLAFIDADDRWHPRLLETSLHRLLADNTLQMTFPCFCHVDSSGIALTKNRVTKTRYGFEDIFVNNPIHSNTGVLINKRAIEEAGCYDTTLSSNIDFDLWLRILRVYPNSIAAINEVLADYRHREGQITGSWQRMALNWQKVADKCMQHSPLLTQRLMSKAFAHQNLYWSSLAEKNDDYKNQRLLVWAAWCAHPGYCVSSRFGLHCSAKLLRHLFRYR